MAIQLQNLRGYREGVEASCTVHNVGDVIKDLEGACTGQDAATRAQS